MWDTCLELRRPVAHEIHLKLPELSNLTSELAPTSTQTADGNHVFSKKISDGQGASSIQFISHNNIDTPMSSADKAAYDAEQERLMEEVCIVIDPFDKALGEGSKRKCALQIPSHPICSV
jgi:hypothetical protein